MKSVEIREYVAQNRDELLDRLLSRANQGDDVPLALAYLINEFVPSDRTTQRVFSSLFIIKGEESDWHPGMRVAEGFFNGKTEAKQLEKDDKDES